MIGELSNHLWQSTIFVVFAALLAVALRKNGAHVRHLVWLTASVKFLVPFSLLMALGSQWAWTRPASASAEVPAIETVSVVMDQIAQPFTEVLPTASPAPRSDVDWAPIAAFAVWAFGCAVILGIRLRGWARIRAAVRASVPVVIPGTSLPTRIDIRASAGLLEPGIVGLRHPILLLPAGIENQLTPAQMEAVLAHECCHIRRRDNITAAFHMIVEAVFWFHPLVWWIGARMVDERERACDEHVLRVLGTPEAYAEGILNVCKLYVESPLTCVSGVTGSNLKKRIEAIMVNRVGIRLNAARKIAITLAAVLALAAPIVAGMITAPVRTSAQAPDGQARFEVVSIKPCGAERSLPGVAPAPPAGFRRGGAAGWHAQTTPGRVYWDCATLATLVDQAYADVDHPLLNMIGDSRPPSLTGPDRPKRVRGGPSWVTSDMFTIEAKAPVELTAPALAGSSGKNLATLPAGMSLALRAVLEDRFKVKVHRVSEQQDMYALKVANGGLDKSRVTLPVPGDCLTKEQYAERMASTPAGPPPRTIAEIEAASPRICGGLYSTMTGMEYSSATLSQLAAQLSMSADRFVLDQTGVDSKLNFKFKSGPGDTSGQRIEAGLALLGLKLQSTKATAEYLVIDRAEQPTPNEAFGASAKVTLPILAAALPPAQVPVAKFEVASIKPCDQARMVAGARGGGAPNFVSSPGRITVNCVNAAYLILRAFIMNGSQQAGDPLNAWANKGSLYDPLNSDVQKIRGGPAWVYADKYSIEASAPGGATDPALWGPMLRALLEDRFQLKLHQETEEAPMWALTVNKDGPKFKSGDCVPFEPGKSNFKELTAANPGKLLCGPWMDGTPEAARWKLGGSPVAELTRVLSQTIGATVVDQTGLTGAFNFVFEAGPDDVFSAVQSQLGLKLTPIKGQRGFLVIDRIERPAPDAPALTCDNCRV